MALTELITARRQVKTGTRVIYTRQWEALKSQVVVGAGGWLGSGITLPAKGDLLGITGMTWSNAVEPRLYSLQLQPHRSRRMTYLVGTYGAPQCQGTASGTYVELADSQDYEVRDTGLWRGYRRYASTAPATDRATIQALSWTVNSIALLPKRVDVNPDMTCPGVSIITAIYESTENPFDYTVNKVRLAAKTEMTWRRAKRDKDGAYIHGNTDVTATFYLRRGIIWKPTQGSDLKPVPKTLVWLKTAYARPITWATSMGLVGKTNNGACANILGAAIGELLCLACDVPETFLIDQNASVVPVIFTLAYRKGGWNKDDDGYNLYSALFHRVPVEKYILHPTDPGTGTRKWLNKDGSAEDGDDAGPTDATDAKTRIVMEDKKIGDDTLRTIHANDGDFSDLNTKIYWGG